MRRQPQRSVAPGHIALELVEVTKRFFQHGHLAVTALDSISLQVKRGQFVVIVGHNGSGKSTLLNIVSGDLVPDAGVLRWGVGCGNGHRPRVARVRQSPGDGTFTDLTVLENFQIFGLAGMPSVWRIQPRPDVLKEAGRRVREHGLANQLGQRVGDLSHGQRQLLALELAMSRRPEVLLLDEHTASLDRSNAASCMEATARLVRESNVTVLMVTHNLTDALMYGDALVVLKDGRIAHSVSGKPKADFSLPLLMRYCDFRDPRSPRGRRTEEGRPSG